MVSTISDRFNRISGIDPENSLANKLERVSYVCLLLTAFAAPHSIAATQTAWLFGALLTTIWLLLRKRIAWKFGLLDAAIIGLFLWTVVTAFLSYDPGTSLGKLRSVAVFVIFYFAVFNLRTVRSAVAVGLVLIASTMINVVWVPVERLIGRGVEIHQTAPDGPLGKALLYNGDTLLDVDGQKIRSPEDLLNSLSANESVDVLFYRPDFEFTVKVRSDDLLNGATAAEQLGIGQWKKSRNWRSSGFYGHYATYAEVLQLVGSLLLGLIAAGILRWRRQEKTTSRSSVSIRKLLAMSGAFLLIAFALLLTVTRAPQLGLVVSAGVATLLGLGRRWLLASAIVILPVAIGALLFLQQSRNVGFIDAADESTRYRTVMLNDGLRIWAESPRNFIFGVGMDSIKKYWREWGMFEGGKMPISHFHSTPLQLLVERGLPALIIWLLMIYAYSRKLFEGIRQTPDQFWKERGILIGALGGLAGFLVSSIVHFNFGDQEVVMVFYLIMALSMAICLRRHIEE